MCYTCLYPRGNNRVPAGTAMRHAAIDVKFLMEELSAMRQHLWWTACMDSLVMSRPCTFCNTTVGCRLESRRALWRVMLGYTDRAGHLHLHRMCISRVATSESQKLHAPLISLLTTTALSGSFPGALRSWGVVYLWQCHAQLSRNNSSISCGSIPSPAAICASG